MSKIPKWQLAADYLNRHGRITAMDIIRECNTVAPHKYIQMLKSKVGLREIQSGEGYKIFVPADKQMILNLK